jgi:cytochrome c oxidase cbb3-type subunit 4
VSFDAFYEFVRTFWVVWLMLVFLGIVGWVLWPRRKEKLEAHGRIPLEDDDDKER